MRGFRATVNRVKMGNLVMERGFTGKELSEKTGLSRQALYHAMDESPVSTATVKKIADALGVSPLEIAEIK